MKKADNAKKYLLYTFPSEEYLRTAFKKTVRMGYIRTDEKVEIKVVEYIEIQQFWLIRKTASPSGRIAYKNKIDKKTFDVLYPATQEKRILKERYELQQGNYKLSFDDFLEDTMLGKIRMLEVESLTETHDEYLLPNESWTEGILDVSNDIRYLNQNLAK